MTLVPPDGRGEVDYVRQYILTNNRYTGYLNHIRNKVFTLVLGYISAYEK